MIRKLYAWAVAMAHKKYATWALAAVSFAESSFFPVPPDAMLVPMVLANRQKAWLFAGVCTVASVAGGLLGYAIGAFLYETVGQWLMHLYHMEDKVDVFRQMYNQYGAEIILIKGLTPIPYKLVTIASGLAEYPVGWFIVLSAITRGVRFFLIAGLLYRFGEPVREFIEKHLEKLSLAFLAIIIAGFVAFAYLG